MRCIGRRWNPDWKREMRRFGLVARKNLVARCAISRHRQPTHEGSVRPDWNRATVDHERSVAATNASENEIRVASREHLIRFGIDDVDFHRTPHIGHSRQPGTARRGDWCRNKWRHNYRGWPRRSARGCTRHSDHKRATGKTRPSRTFHIRNRVQEREKTSLKHTHG